MLKGLTEFKDRLRSKRMRVTPQRLAVLQILTRTQKHPDAESIFAEVRKIFPEISPATVYSTLKSLQKIGFVQEIGTFGSVRRFDGYPQPHPHLICLGCNKIEDLAQPDKKDVEKLELSVSKKTKYRLIKSCFSFYGYCPHCKNNIKKKAFKF